MTPLCIRRCPMHQMHAARLGTGCNARSAVKTRTEPVGRLVIKDDCDHPTSLRIVVPDTGVTKRRAFEISHPRTPPRRPLCCVVPPLTYPARSGAQLDNCDILRSGETGTGGLDFDWRFLCAS
jgi:hypothetical protein